MLKLSGPIWISVYDVADVFDLPPRMVGRSRTRGLVAVQAVRVVAPISAVGDSWLVGQKPVVPGDADRLRAPAHLVGDDA